MRNVTLVREVQLVRECKRDRAISKWEESDWNLLDEWSMDLLTDLPVTKRGFKHVLLVV